MSADAWRVCPRCRDRADKKAEQEAIDVTAKYGKIPHDEYMREFKAATARAEEELEDTLREDYELRTDEEGRFYVNYSCYCTACGFEHKFRHEQQLDLR
jgi:hypothetical protein